MENKKIFLYFYILPTLIFILASVILFLLNQTFLRKSIERTYFERLSFLGSFFKLDLSKEKKLENISDFKGKIVDQFYKSKDVVYYAFRVNKDSLLYWNSKYEGFLPIFTFYPQKDISIRTIKTPVGKIFELNVKEKLDGKDVVLTIGFMQVYSNILKRAHLRILVLFNILIVIFLFLYYIKIMEYNQSFVEREKAIEKERREKEVFKTLSTLSMTLSHELRNPLNSLNLIFEKIIMEKSRENAVVLAKRGEQEIERIKRFTKSFEMLLKKEAGEKVEIGLQTKDKIDIKSLLTSIVKNLLSKKVIININEVGKKILVEGDRELLSILFYYLLKSFFEGLDEENFLKISIDYNKKMIEIKSSGKAIFSSELFSHPEKGENFSSEKGDTLFLIRKIIEFHNWDISFDSYELGDIIIINFKGG